jgi:hypothetical protein
LVRALKGTRALHDLGYTFRQGINPVSKDAAHDHDAVFLKVCNYVVSDVHF